MVLATARRLGARYGKRNVAIAGVAIAGAVHMSLIGARLAGASLSLPGGGRPVLSADRRTGAAGAHTAMHSGNRALAPSIPGAFLFSATVSF